MTVSREVQVQFRMGAVRHTPGTHLPPPATVTFLSVRVENGRMEVPDNGDGSGLLYRGG